MKIAVLSDIHASWVALQAVAADIEHWQPDRVILAGDFINRGPRPLECWQFVQEQRRTRNWQVILGNHEEYIFTQAQPDAPRNGPVFDVHQASYWTWLKLKDDMEAIRSLPSELRFNSPDGSPVIVTHASMCGNRDGIYPETTNADLADKIVDGCGCDPRAKPPRLLLVGHTHRPLIRRLNGTVVVNAGSAGLPFDRDTRPSYARLTWQDNHWSTQIARVDYNLAAAQQDFIDTGYLTEAGPLIELVMIELRDARPLLGGWAGRFQQAVMNGTISMAESVNQYLSDIA